MPTILVADDEVAITTFITDALTDEGYYVRAFHDGASALLAIQAEVPALALLDNAMPIMTGMELLIRLRSAGVLDLPVIIMSAGSGAEAFLRHGAAAFLPKPFDLTKLLNCIEQHLDHD